KGTRTCSGGSCSFSCNAGFDLCTNMSACSRNLWDFEDGTTQGYSVAAGPAPMSMGSPAHSGTSSLRFSVSTSTTATIDGFFYLPCPTNRQGKTLSAYFFHSTAPPLNSQYLIAGGSSTGPATVVSAVGASGGFWDSLSTPTTDAGSQNATYVEVRVTISGPWMGTVFIDDISWK
ncbi:MAG TPA: hypothetical protein VHU40_12080, partial [Polyangia bacterium]|nr:hypothetical protein [Polyangia bacterium]